MGESADASYVIAEITGYDEELGGFSFRKPKQYVSVGRLIFRGWISDKITSGEIIQEILAAESDIIDLDIPFLLARDVLDRMKDQIDFSARTVQMERKIPMDLIFPTRGHVLSEWIFEPKNAPIVEEQNHLNLIYSSSCAEDTQIDQQQVRKLDIQFGHADSAALIRTLRQAKKPLDDQMIQAVVQSCRCGRSSGPGQEAVIGRNVSTPHAKLSLQTHSPQCSPNREDGRRSIRLCSCPTKSTPGSIYRCIVA